MIQQKIDRINELARKAKNGTLTEAEVAERSALRAEYVAGIRASLQAQLDNTYIETPDGTRRKLQKKG